MPIELPNTAIIIADVERALHEDVGNGDATAHLIPANTISQAKIICRETAVVAGQAWANQVFQQVDQAIQADWHTTDGEHIDANTILCTLEGPARSLLTAERTALNFLQTMSSTATQTRRYVDAVAKTGVTLLDTRKTLPGLRQAQKYAVRCGGGQNHRHGLYDAILIKENHIAATGSIETAIKTARQAYPDLLLEVEVQSIAELEIALAAEPDRILLDNFSEANLTTAVNMTGGMIPLEASGGITLSSICRIAKTGVDFISLGTLTKDINAIDLSMLFKTTSP